MSNDNNPDQVISMFPNVDNLDGKATDYYS